MAATRTSPSAPNGHAVGRQPSRLDKDRALLRAAQLLRILVHDVILSEMVERLQVELARARQVVREHECEELQLRAILHRALTDVRPMPARMTNDDRRSRVIATVIERVHRDLSRPLQLRLIAHELGMNPNHLSTLFARRVGLPFKRYLTLLRLQRAQQLLSEPTQRVAEVARSVGYASPDRFRAAFRAWTGYAPGTWRDLMRAD